MNGDGFRDLEKEVHKLEIEAYVNMVDKEYERVMMELKSDFTNPCTPMISKVLIAIHYRQFQEEFPLCHRVYASVVSTRYYSVPGVCSNDVEATEKDIHSKKRMILFLFYGLI